MSMINGTRLYDHLTRLGRIGFVPKEEPHDCRIPLPMTKDESMFNSAWNRQDFKHPSIL